MTTNRSLTIQNGIFTQHAAGDTLDVGAGITGVTGSALSINAATSQYIALTINAVEKARVTSTGGFAVGTTTDPGAGKIGLSNGVFSNNILGLGILGTFGNTGTGTGVSGTTVGIISGLGWASDNVNVGTAGGDVYVVGQDGGASSATKAAGAGGSVAIMAGGGGSNSLGGGGANGGSVQIDAGGGTGGALTGTISIGTSKASAITISKTGVVVSTNGPLRVNASIGFGATPSGAAFDASTVGQRWNARSVASGTTFANTDRVLITNITSGNIAHNLPTPATVGAGFVASFVTHSTASNSNKLTITRLNSENIDGVAADKLQIAGQRLDLITDGTDWFTMNATGQFPNRVTVNDADYTVAIGDYRIAYITNITAARNVTGPSTLSTQHAGWEIVIKDESGAASGTNTITFTPGTGTIDGAASKVVINASRGSWRGYFNGTDWHTSA